MLISSKFVLISGFDNILTTFLQQIDKDSLDKYLSDRHYTSEDVLNDPIYSGQIRVIPTDQLTKATEWLERKIADEAVKRPEQVKRYQDTLNLFRDRISDNEGRVT